MSVIANSWRFLTPTLLFDLSEVRHPQTVGLTSEKRSAIRESV